MIPKIIWQTHEWELGDLPDAFKESMNSWRDMNAEWDYRYISARERLEHIRDYGGEELLKYYKECNKLTQADLWRYLILYKFGGVYSDMDFRCISPIDQMIESKYKENSIIVHSLMQDVRYNFLNGLIGSNSGEPVFKELIDNAIKKFKSLPANKKNLYCGHGCCRNNDRECNGRDDYHLGYEYFSMHIQRHGSLISPTLHLVAQPC